jgi:hypothetical protein
VQRRRVAAWHGTHNVVQRRPPVLRVLGARASPCEQRLKARATQGDAAAEVERACGDGVRVGTAAADTDARGAHVARHALQRASARARRLR